MDTIADRTCSTVAARTESEVYLDGLVSHRTRSAGRIVAALLSGLPVKGTG